MAMTDPNSPSFMIPAADAFERMMQPDPPMLLDVRRPQAVTSDPWLVPQALLADPLDAIEGLPHSRRGFLVICAHGHNRSQSLAARLRASGHPAAIVTGGYDGWRQARLPLARQALGPATLGARPTLWVTRRRPKIDRVACPWLIRRFLDAQATFLFVEPDQVLPVAGDLSGLAFDTPGAPFEHDGGLCTFDVLLRETGLDQWAPLTDLARIIRAADTDRLDLAPQASGLLALSLGLSHRHGENDHAMIAEGFGLYDNLLSWVRHASAEAHHWQQRGA